MKSPLRPMSDLASRYRKYLITAASVVLLYALLGFFLAPWLINKIAIDSVRETTGAELRLEKVALNPFVLSLRINGLELDDPTGDAFARVEEIFVNFQLSSLFRWAWTFDEIRTDAPQLFLTRGTDGALNLSRFRSAAAKPSTDVEAQAQAGSMPRLLIYDFTINRGSLRWNDEVPAETVDTEFGPINIRVQQLNTLPERSGEQTVVITTESHGSLSWSGALQLNPFSSAGHAAVKGSHFPLTSAYFRHKAGFDIVRGDADIDLDYAVEGGADGKITATIDNIDVVLSDVLVRTFTSSDDDDVADTDRDVLLLPAVRLNGGTMHWPEQTVSVSSFTIDDAVLSIYRDATGVLNIVRTTSPSSQDSVSTDAGTAAAETEPQAGGPAPNPWHLSLDEFAIRRFAFGLEDESVRPTANIGIKSLDLTVGNLSNESGARFPTSLALVFPSGGTGSLEGEFGVLPQPVFEFNLAVDKAALAAVHPYLKPLADVNLDSGTLDIAAHVIHDDEEILAFSGDLDINDFLITETDKGSHLGSWKRFHLDKIAYSATKQTLEISEVRLDRPYGDVRIGSDGSVNLGRVAKDENGASEDDDNDGAKDAVKPSGDATADASSNVVATTVGRVVIANASADFEDQSLPLPFAARIAELNGDITTIVTASRDPSSVELEGKVDEYGLVRITGSVTPLDPKLNTDLKVAFQNVEMPKFSAYTIPFAGREIASGKLDLDLGYKVQASELIGENKVVLRDFELGEKVDHPGAMSLPLGLAVALLKDAEGKIDIDLPVRGNVDDPEFKYGGVVLKALANLIVKIVTSPFALLGKLVGVEASDLEYITFLRGRADLTPPEMERIAKIAEALSLRPELVLEVSGVVDRDADGLALRTAMLQQIVDDRIAAAGQGDESMYAEQQKKVLEALFIEQGAGEERRLALQELVVQFTATTTNAETGAQETQFDSLAYTNEIRRQLIEVQPMTDTELAALANDRASNTRAAFLGINAELDARIVPGKAQAVEAKDDEAIRMKVTLKAD